MLFVTILLSVLAYSHGSGVYYGAEPPVTFGSELGNFSTAAIASDARPCAKVGMDVIREGGFAVDAAVAAVICDGLFNPHSTGIGGGLFMTIYLKESNSVITLNARETAPSYADKDMFGGDTLAPQYGPFAMGVPGVIKALYEAKQRYGNPITEWSRLLQPSIDLARTGIEVGFSLASALLEKEVDIRNDPGLSSIFINPNTGELWEEGDYFTWDNLANTLDRIAENGEYEFYSGTTAINLIQDVRNSGGNLSVQDLQDYEVLWEDSISIPFGAGFTLHTSTLPSSGPVLIKILNVLKNYNFGPSDVDPIVAHRTMEAFKWAFADRSKMGDPFDPAITDLMNELVANITSETLAYETYMKINDSFTVNNASYYGADFYTPEDHGTSHISIIGANGDAVAVTNTVNLYFGNKFMSPSTGIILNDEMDDFSYPNISNYFGVPPSENNFPIPGKRPLSSMCPMIVVDDVNQEAKLVLGGAGGTRIITSNAIVAMRSLWFGEDIKTAIDANRLHHQLAPMEVAYEEGTDEALLEDLRSKGHVVNPASGGSVNCGIVSEDGRIYANADGRKDGAVDGF